MPTPKRKPVAPLQDLVLRVSLREITPEIWRRLVVPREYTLAQLHRTLQLTFAWLDYHLHAFEIGERQFEAPDEEAEGESTAIRMTELPIAEGDRFLYRYDYGDDWEHDILVEAVKPVHDPQRPRWPQLLGGERASPPEDCGGPGGYEELVAGLKRSRSQEGRELRMWVGPDYDPATFDAWQVGRMLTMAAAYGAI